jgi:hypothetical protein
MKKWILLIGIIFYSFAEIRGGQPEISALPVEGSKGGSAGRSEVEKVTYLGVSVVPAGETISAQLKLARGAGLVVVYVDPEGPSGKILEKNDVLYKLNDQILVHPEQLAVLVRMFKPGDEVSLEIFRAGTLVNLKVKLGERTITPGEAGASRMLPFFRFYTPRKNEEILDKIGKWLDDMGMEKDRIRDTAESIWKDIMETLRDVDDAPSPFPFGRRRESGIDRRATDSKVVSVSPDGASYSDGEHRLVITRTERGLMLSAKDKTGKPIFEGPIDTEEQLARIPGEIQQKVRELREKLLAQSQRSSDARRETM